MLNKTHLSIGLFFMLLFIPRVVHIYSYVLVFLISTVLPNIDSIPSGKNVALKPLALFLKKRGFMHSFTLCFAVTLLLTWFFPVYAFPFFLGYGMHLLIDAWTVEGIRPFWPFRAVSSGKIRTGGALENILFYCFIVADLIALYILFF